MKLHRTVVLQIIEALYNIFAEGRYADKAIEYHFKTHPKWGARDRKLFAESVYDIVRSWRWYWHLAGQLDVQHKQPEDIVATASLEGLGLLLDHEAREHSGVS